MEEPTIRDILQLAADQMVDAHNEGTLREPACLLILWLHNGPNFGHLLSTMYDSDRLQMAGALEALAADIRTNQIKRP